jgi:hypothetical protein
LKIFINRGHFANQVPEILLIIVHCRMAASLTNRESSMTLNKEISLIEALFRKQVKKGTKIKNAILLVHSDNTGLHLNISEGPGDNGKPEPRHNYKLPSDEKTIIF